MTKKIMEIERVEGQTGIVQVGPTVENFIQTALEKGLPVETLERLMVMRDNLKKEKAKEQYFAAMAEFQEDCPVIEKDKVVKFSTKTGDKVDYRYAPMDSIITQVKKRLARWGFSYKFELEETATTVKATCIATHVDGHQEESSFTAGIGGTGLMSSSQKSSGAATYAKRIAFCNVFGITTGDDDNDGNNADKQKFDLLTQEQKDRIDELTTQAQLEMAYVTQSCQKIFGRSYTQLTKSQGDTLIGILERKLEEKANKAGEQAKIV